MKQVLRTLVSQHQNVSIQDFIGAQDDGSYEDNYRAIRCAKLQTNHHHQQTNTQLFTGRMPFLSPNSVRALRVNQNLGTIDHFFTHKFYKWNFSYIYDDDDIQEDISYHQFTIILGSQ